MGTAYSSTKSVDRVILQRVGRLLSEKLTEEDGSQKEKARRIGISQPIVSQLQRGRGSLGLSVAMRIADYLGVSMDDLLGRRSPNASGTERHTERSLVLDALASQRRRLVRLVESLIDVEPHETADRQRDFEAAMRHTAAASDPDVGELAQLLFEAGRSDSKDGWVVVIERLKAFVFHEAMLGGERRPGDSLRMTRMVPDAVHAETPPIEVIAESAPQVTPITRQLPAGGKRASKPRARGNR